LNGTSGSFDVSCSSSEGGAPDQEEAATRPTQKTGNRSHRFLNSNLYTTSAQLSEILPLFYVEIIRNSPFGKRRGAKFLKLEIRKRSTYACRYATTSNSNTSRARADDMRHCESATVSTLIVRDHGSGGATSRYESNITALTRRHRRRRAHNRR
jgi:hypothetical protein